MEEFKGHPITERDVPVFMGLGEVQPPVLLVPSKPELHPDPEQFQLQANPLFFFEQMQMFIQGPC